MRVFAGKDADNQTILASAAPGAQAKPFPPVSDARSK